MKTETPLQDPGILIKCVVEGAGGAGKTCMSISYTTDKFPVENVPTVMESYTVKTVVDGQKVYLALLTVLVLATMSVYEYYPMQRLMYSFCVTPSWLRLLWSTSRTRDFLQFAISVPTPHSCWLAPNPTCEKMPML